MPSVALLHAPADPLGCVASMAAMYEGRVIRHRSDLSWEDRLRYWDDTLSTKLDTPLEAVDFVFLLEGVDRAITHQIVRKRTGAAYAQESLRFAVPGRLAEATSLPPSLQGTLPNASQITGSLRKEHWRNTWQNAINTVDAAYETLVSSGMPAEEARGLLPHATATRMIWKVNLRSLKEEAGVRLCTQAQFHWKILFSQVLLAIRQYTPDCQDCNGTGYYETGVEYMGHYEGGACPTCEPMRGMVHAQYDHILNSKLFRPACYAHGSCPFKASFDRGCTIRERADRGAFDEIRDEEWLTNPAAARTKKMEGWD